jgi:hypothetical protein
MKNRRNFIRNIISLGIAGGLTAFFSKKAISSSEEEKLFIHHVFFWLNNPENKEDRVKFESALSRLGSIETITMLHIGKPADTNREVIDNTYTYSFLAGFKNKKDHDIYQAHPIHDEFRNNYGDMWKKVLVYDSLDI